MTLLSLLRPFALAALVALPLVGPANAQQRIQVGEMIQRIDRLETEVARLRVSRSGGGGADIARLDQIEQELRRLTGIIERLEYDTRRAASETEARLDGMDERLDAMEGAPKVAVAPPPSGVGGYGSGPFAPPPPPASNTAPFEPDSTFGAPGIGTPPDPFAPATPAAAPVTQSASALYSDGVRLLNIGSFDEAGARFEDLIATYPQDPKAGEAQFWLGDMHFKLGRFEQAATAFLDSFRNWPEGPKAPDSLLKLGMTLANIGKTEEACLSFKQVPARYPGASPSLLRRADIESQRNRCG